MRDTATVKGEAVCGHCQRSAEDWQPVECRVPRIATLLELLEAERLYWQSRTDDVDDERLHAEAVIDAMDFLLSVYREEASRGAT